MDAKEFIRTHETPFNDVTFRKGDVIKIHIELLYKIMEEYHQSKVNNSVLDDVIKCKPNPFEKELNDFAKKTRKTKPNKPF
jgi:hypothetical protein